VLDRKTFDYLGMRSTVTGDGGEKAVELVGLEAEGAVDQVGRRP
jgi:hypothetical protein